MTYDELKYRQTWILEQKIDHAVATVDFFLSQTGGKGYISFSGGKDSTVMLDIIRRYVDKNIPAVRNLEIFAYTEALTASVKLPNAGNF